MSERSAVDRWRVLVEGRRRQMDAAYAALQRDSSDFWARRAGRYPRYADASGADSPLVRRVLMLLPSGGSVLDVGAGTGRYTLPIACHAGRVTAVEPSVAMAERLMADAAAIENAPITVVQSGWLEAQGRIAPADLVLCTHVLYPHAEIDAWLRTLDAHARVGVVLELMVDWREPRVLLDLWQRYHDEPRILQPTYFDVYAVLHELGVPANVEVYHAGRSSFWTFHDLDEAVAAAREHLILPATPEVDTTLRAALRDHLRRDEDAWELPSRRVAATIWWEAKGPRLATERSMLGAPGVD